MIASCLETSSLRNTFIEELGFVEGRGDTGKLGSNIICYPSYIYIIYVMWVNNDINHPFGNGLYHLCIVIWEMVYGIFLPTITLI